ncbi:hypothetical protein JNUCC1_01482 [Lentibacillus sp. JNUCC-1]|uniref:hypothetical protein n=1 Tax=Lentibacillus sp. JNUCC-1 TaxID=2654513 RepID=UPI0012E98AAB|nr:hypothetical protein [Lentibacillus sp. JNUCC-1]MUV37676.1 hypothetical protein [Lentibacillus sp. JNUCC-1]
MIFNKPYGYWSAVMGLAGTLFLIASYVVAPDHPQGLMSGIIMLLMVLAGLSLISGIVTSIIGIKNKEAGTKKYIGILMPILITLFFILVPVIMALGFMLNDNP